MNVLVIAGHPDDEVLGCGATVRRLAGEGHEVHIAIFGEGATSRYADRGSASGSEVELLVSQAQEAGRILGAASVRTLGLPDNRFDSLPILDVIKMVEALVGELTPSQVFTHHPGDLNIDHRILFRATLTACRPLAGHLVQELLCFEIPSSTEWAFQRSGPSFQPTVFYNIRETLPQKLEAMDVYSGEVRPFPHPRSPEALTAYAHRWGSVVGVDAAEAFELVRVVR
ncbi:MAG: PIG-L family deacetylase [Deltaproteobacteria bacterium]|nr:PIG-L family deacetylase [Deltaproteobacteria bacterium]